MDDSEKPRRPDPDRVREALGDPGERPDGRRPSRRADDPERQREARERLADDEDAEGGEDERTR